MLVTSPTMLPQPLSCPWIVTGFQWLSQRWLLYSMKMLTMQLLPRVCKKMWTAIHFLVMLNLLFGILSHQYGLTNLSSISKILEVISSMCSLQCWPQLCCLYTTTMKEKGERLVSKVKKKCPFYVRKVHPWPSVAVTGLREVMSAH